MQLPTRYSYNGSWGRLLWVLLFFGSCSAFMAYTAAHNKAGLIIEGIIRLGPSGAAVFYWVNAALSGAFVLLGLLLMVNRIVNPQFLMLETDALLLPGGLFQRRTSRISYADIQECLEVQIYRQTFLHLAVYGRRFTINAALFPHKADYAAVRDFLVTRARRQFTKLSPVIPN